MSSVNHLPIVLLYTNGREKIEGATRFQKLVFLAQEESDVPDIYEYEAEKFGPFSAELAHDVDRLIQQGLVEKHTRYNEIGQEKYVYTLTPKGIAKAQELLDQSKLVSVFDAMAEIKEEYNTWRLDHLLRYVYRTYEEYTTETQLDTDRLFDPDATSEFADPVEEHDVSEDGPDPKYRDYLVDAHAFRNASGEWTARDREEELTAQGDTKAAALNTLGELIAATQGDAGHRPTDEEIRELGVDPETARDGRGDTVPEFMQ